VAAGLLGGRTAKSLARIEINLPFPRTDCRQHVADIRMPAGEPLQRRFVNRCASMHRNLALGKKGMTFSVQQPVEAPTASTVPVLRWSAFSRRIVPASVGALSGAIVRSCRASHQRINLRRT